MTGNRAPSVPAAQRAFPPCGPSPVRIGAAPSLLRAIPHLPAFAPDAETVALVPGAGSPDFEWLRGDAVATTAAPALRWAEGPFPAPAFGAHLAPVIIFAAPGVARDPLGTLLRQAATAAPAGPPERRRAGRLREWIAAERLGGTPGLPDPGPRGLQCGPGEVVIVLLPSDGEGSAAAQRMLRQARARAAGRPLRVLRRGAEPAALAAWTLLDAAAELHTLDDEVGLLGLMAGKTVYCDPSASYAPWAAGGPRDGLDLLAAVVRFARCADPFTRRPARFEDALALLATWRRVEAENRTIAVCVGMSFWKRRRIAAAFASAHGVPAFCRTAGAAVDEAARRGGAIAVWASRCPRDLPARAKAANIPLLRLEDGFIRSAGLGADFLPGASFVLDRRAPHYDPAIDGDLERLLASTAFPPHLLARAEDLIAALRRRGVTKYNLGGAMPVLPASDGRRRILVPGQVADDLSVLHGATGAVQDDSDLLRAVREAEPHAFLIYKPHPDVVAGHRRGGAAADTARLADLVVTDAPMAGLLEAVDSVHTLTSLTGFEALLRDRTVTCWGQPFYAGWGLTDDRVPHTRRTRRLALPELVAGALILYPRYIDPVTDLPCTPEVLLDRLADPAPWRAGPVMRLRRLQGRIAGTLRRALARGPAA